MALSKAYHQLTESFPASLVIDRKSNFSFFFCIFKIAFNRPV